MDLICVNCGEPWSIDHVLHDAPHQFKRSGGVIRHCPCCSQKKALTEEEKFKLESINALGELLGDDIDGLAAEIENFGLI